jgi:hypothetical protein
MILPLVAGLAVFTLLLIIRRLRQAHDAPVEEISRPTMVHRIRQIVGLNGRSATADHR